MDGDEGDRSTRLKTRSAREGLRIAMRTIEYDAHVRENRERYLHAWFASERLKTRRAVRRRPRSSAEVALLDLLAENAWRQAIESGTLREVAPRRYILRV